MIDAQIKGNFTNSVILTAIGLMLAVIGAFAFTGHMLNPTTVIGALNYMTIGTIVMISQSTVFKNLLYDQIPERVREVLFES